MNNVNLTGRLTQNAVCFGKNKETLKFSLACRSGYDPATKKPRVDFVPCVFFNASDKLRALLMDSGKGKPVELRGRISTSSFESNGERKFATEVLVDARDFYLQFEEKGASHARTGNSKTPARDLPRSRDMGDIPPAWSDSDRSDRLGDMVP